MSIPFRSLRRHAALMALVAVTACAVPTEPRWDRSAPVGSPPTELNSTVVRYVVESAPVVASTEFRSRIVPADEIVITAPGDGRVVSRLVATGNAVAADEPILEWTAGADEATELRVQILELGIELAELEGRTTDAADARAELAEARAAADRQNTEVIVSPIGGVVGRHIIDRSVQFAEGEALVTVGDPARTRVDIVVTPDAADGLTVGDTLRIVDAQNRFAEPIPAVITEIISPLRRSPDTDTVVTAVLDGSSNLPVGTRVIVNVDRQSGRASLRVATDAVLDDGLGPFVVVENDTGWRRVDVDVGLTTDDFVQLLTELEVGTTVVVP